MIESNCERLVEIIKQFEVFGFEKVILKKFGVSLKFEKTAEAKHLRNEDLKKSAGFYGA